jgi:3-hydroxybutyryl-CoA dehydratase
MSVAEVSPPRVGDTRRGRARTITEADIVQFAALTRDFSRLHTDAAYAARSVFGRRVGHGLLGLALAEGSLAAADRGQRLDGIVGAWEWNFLAPFFAGDTLSARATVVGIEAAGDLRVAIEEVSLANQRGIELQRGRHRLALAPRRGEHAWLHAVLTAPFGTFEGLRLSEDDEEGRPPPASSAGPEVLDETGVFYEDLQPGDGFLTPALTIGEYEVAAFLGLIGDTAPWFNNHALARAAGFPGPLVPPLFGLALIEGLKYCLAPDRGVGIPIASLSWRWRHVAPLAVGDTVRAEVTVAGKRASRTKTDRGPIAQAIHLFACGRAPLQDGQHVQMFRRRPSAGPPRSASLPTGQQQQK